MFSVQRLWFVVYGLSLNLRAIRVSCAIRLNPWNLFFKTIMLTLRSNYLLFLLSVINNDE